MSNERKKRKIKKIEFIFPPRLMVNKFKTTNSQTRESLPTHIKLNVYTMATEKSMA